MQRNMSMDDLWSALGYLLLVGVNGAFSASVDLPIVSAMVAAALAVFWVVNQGIRVRSPNPNARVVFWAIVAVVSGAVALVS